MKDGSQAKRLNLIEKLLRRVLYFLILYGKMVNRTRKFKAHDEENACGIGDTVRIMETRPISKDKRWRIVEIIEKAK